MTQSEIKDFKSTLLSYKNRIDKQIQIYVKDSQKQTLKNYGPKARLALDAYLELLQRGGKRIRGSLVIHAYEMQGGTDKNMIEQAALAVEMLHAYILIIDDIQDRSPLRRDGPTAHKLLENYHQKHELAGDSAHFGLSIALNAALEGAHAANRILTELNVDESIKLEVINLANKTMQTTAYGQTGDILNEVVAEVTEQDIDSVLELKTAHYTIKNPIQIGMTLAGADLKSIKKVEKFAHHAGRLFQITDDILGTFGSEFESGKSPMDDTREGKRTVLTVYALEHADNGNKNFVYSCLGYENLSPASFERFKQILVDCGALKYAHECAENDAEQAKKALKKFPESWPAEGTDFLEKLLQNLLDRKS